MSNNLPLYTALLGLTMTLPHSEASAKAIPAHPTYGIAAPDTINYDDMEDGVADSLPKSRHNTAKEFNALKYILEDRYRNYGDRFTKRWNDHLFAEFGAGVQQDIKGLGEGLSPLTSAHLSIGKQFNRLHTARLNFGLGYGYYENSKYNYYQTAASADWLFSFSSYIDGYKPSRLLDVSSVIGAGIRYNLTSGNFATRCRYEIHGGMQFKFFTGPQGYLAIEPYMGVTSKSLENKFGGFYGVNVSAIYYLNNNLSIEERMRYMKNRPAVVDSVLRPSPWRTPWFAEVAGGLTMFHGSGNSNATKIGHATALSFGKWFSPVAGLRLSGTLSTSTWNKEPVDGISQKVNRHNTNADARAEILINPLGFAQNYNWDRPYGAYLTLGGGIGWLMKSQERSLHNISTFYTGGVHLWSRLTDDLQFFVEPRYTNYNYKIPYSNANRNARFTDDVYTLNIGLTAYTRGLSYRHKAPQYEAPALPMSFGVGGGTSLFFTHNAYDGAKTNYNFGAWAEYHITRIHGVRLGFEYMGLNSREPIIYSLKADDGTTYRSGAMVDYSHTRGFLSLDYHMNVTNFFSGYQGRRMFEGEMFVGPTIMFAMSSKSKLSSTPPSDIANRIHLSDKYYDKPLMGANGGIKLKFNMMPHLALTLTPQVHVLRYDPQLNGLHILKFRMFETLDFGVQYDL